MATPRDGAPIAVVVATRDRRAELLTTLARLRALPERPQVVVVDNASADGTPDAVRREAPWVTLVALEHNAGAAARTVGVRHARAPVVAFSDDDSWWAPGSLARAAALFAVHPRLALAAARVLVGPDDHLDPTCALMADSPLRRPRGAPGVPVLGFVACGAVVRRHAFLDAGGFEPRFGVGGEEELLAVDLSEAGWWLLYLPELVAHHHPSPSRDPAARRRRQLRNALWAAWLRRPAPAAARTSARLIAAHRPPREALGTALAAARGAPWVLRRRRVVGPGVERGLRALERQAAGVV